MVPVGAPVVVPVVVPPVVPVVPEPLLPPTFALVPVSALVWLAAGVGVVDEGEREPEPPLDPHAAASAMAPIGRRNSLMFTADLSSGPDASVGSAKTQVRP